MKQPTKATQTNVDAYTQDERQTIIDNIKAFAQTNTVETFRTIGGVLVRDEQPMTHEQLRWLECICADVAGLIDHQ